MGLTGARDRECARNIVIMGCLCIGERVEGRGGGGGRVLYGGGGLDDGGEF